MIKKDHEVLELELQIPHYPHYSHRRGNLQFNLCWRWFNSKSLVKKVIMNWRSCGLPPGFLKGRPCSPVSELVSWQGQCHCHKIQLWDGMSVKFNTNTRWSMIFRRNYIRAKDCKWWHTSTKEIERLTLWKALASSGEKPLWVDIQVKLKNGYLWPLWTGLATRTVIVITHNSTSNSL